MSHTFEASLIKHKVTLGSAERSKHGHVALAHTTDTMRAGVDLVSLSFFHRPPSLILLLLLLSFYLSFYLLREWLRAETNRAWR